MKFTAAHLIALLMPAAVVAAAAALSDAHSVRLRGAPHQAQAQAQRRHLAEGDFSLSLIVSFILNSGNYSLTDDEQMFAKYCVRRSYNSIHDPEAVVMKFADITSLDIVPLPETRKLTTSPISAGWVFSLATLGTCRLCSKTGRRHLLRDVEMITMMTTEGSVDLIQPSHAGATNDKNGRSMQQTSWETALCDLLSQGPFASFADVSNCAIIMSLPDMGINDGVEDVQFGVTADFTMSGNGNLTTDEQAFVNDCARLAYNEVHDASVAFMEKADLASQTHQQSSTSSSYASWSLEWAAHGSFLNVTAYDDDSNDTITSWQDAFCAKLVSGPYAVLHSAENCQMSVSAVVPSA